MIYFAVIPAAIFGGMIGYTFPGTPIERKMVAVLCAIVGVCAILAVIGRMS